MEPEILATLEKVDSLKDYAGRICGQEEKDDRRDDGDSINSMDMSFKIRSW